MKSIKVTIPIWSKQMLIVLALCLATISCNDKKEAEAPESGNTSQTSSGTETWNKANLTYYESYPEPGSQECAKFNGCTWAGQFAFLDDKQPLSWVKTNNIIAVHTKDGEKYKLKTIRLKQGDKTIDVKVYDTCSDRDCDNCCTINAKENGLNFLIDIEKYTMQRFGSGEGIVEWRCLDCN